MTELAQHHFGLKTHQQSHPQAPLSRDHLVVNRRCRNRWRSGVLPAARSVGDALVSDGGQLAL